MGNKNELVERLQNACVDGVENQSHISDDLLDELDDELDDKELLHDDHEDELLNPSPEQEKKKPELINQQKSNDKAPVATKKVSLKRNLSIQTPVLEKVEDKPEDNKNEIINEPPKKISKISELSADERRRIRLQKFGSATPIVDLVQEDEKKAARAIRFGISSSSNSAASITRSAPVADLDKFKKRAERFGATTATKLNQVEQQEKLQKRQERFGGADSEDKAQKRLERFKITV